MADSKMPEHLNAREGELWAWIDGDEGDAEGTRTLLQTISDLRGIVKEVAELQPKQLQLLREKDYIFNRFPRNMKENPPKTESERWEALAFHLYSTNADLSGRAARKLIEEEKV